MPWIIHGSAPLLTSQRMEDLAAFLNLRHTKRIIYEGSNFAADTLHFCRTEDLTIILQYMKAPDLNVLTLDQALRFSKGLN